MVSLAAEFPNDNPALHCGVSWVCLDITGAAVAMPHPVPVAVASASTSTSTSTTEHESAGASSMSVAELLTAEPPSAPMDVDVDVDVVVDALALALDVPVPVPVPVPDLSCEPALSSAPALSPEEEIPRARISGIVGLGETPRDDSEHDLSAVAADDDEEPILVEDLPPLDETATLEGIEPAAEVASTTTLAPPPSDDPWVVLLSALADVAIGAGSPHVASVLPALLLHGTLDAMPDDATQALAEANVFRSNEVTPAFVAQTRAWRGILLGTSDDFAACGNAMLDEWAADLLARLLGAPSRAAALKRELRSRGVAGFGLVEAA